MKRVGFILALLFAGPAIAGGHLGNFAPGDTIDCKFGTVRPSSGASYTLSGDPAAAVYKDNGTTESTTGVSLTADFDSRTGLNHVRVTTASDGTFYSAGSYFEIVLTSGSVDGVSVVGQPVCSFTLGKESTNVTHWGGTAVGSATVSANVTQISGDSTAADNLEAAFDGTTGAVAPLGIARQGTAQSATSTTLVLDSAASFADDVPIGMTLVACGSTQGYCQARVVTDYTGSNDTATVDAWTVTPSGTITYYLFATAPVSIEGGSGGGGATAEEIADEVESRFPSNFGSLAISSAGVVNANVTQFGGSAGTFTSGQPTVRLSSGTGTGQISLSSGQVTVGTNNDKTGYRLSTTGVDDIWDEELSGHSTAGTAGKALADILDDTGSSGVVVASGSKSGYSLASDQSGVTIGTVNALGSQAKSDVNAEVDSAITSLASDVGDVKSVTDKLDTMLEAADEDYKFTAGALAETPVGEGGGLDAAGIRNAIGLATANLDTQLSGISAVTAKLDDTLEDQGGGTYGFTEAALQKAPTGGGSGGDDAETIAQAVATELGDGSGFTAITDAIAGLNDVSTSDVQSAVTSALNTYDPPTRSELTSDINSVLSAISGLNDIDANALRDVIIEDQGGGVSLGCALSVIMAYAAGDLATTGNSPTYKDPSGGETRISGSISSPGNRSMTITCPSY